MRIFSRIFADFSSKVYEFYQISFREKFHNFRSLSFRSFSRQEFVFPEFVFPEFVFPEFVFQEFVFQEFVTAPFLLMLLKEQLVSGWFLIISRFKKII